MTTPLLLIDVDGPLNPYAAKPHRRPEGYTTHRMRPAGWESDRRKALRVWLNPSHGAALSALPFELVWCTTWEHDANTMIAPIIGLPTNLPVIEWPPPTIANRLGTTDGTYWKTHHAVKYAAGRPFAWIDDETTPVDEEYVAAHHQGPALIRTIDPRLGLLEDDFTALTAWAVALGSAAV